MKKIVLLSLLFSAFSLNANPVKWTYSVNQLQGNKAELVFSATVTSGYQMYAVQVPPNGPLPTEFDFDDSKMFQKVGKIKEVSAPKIKFDEIFEMNIGVHTGNARFVQAIEILSEKDFLVTGTINYMVCDEVSCLPQDHDFSFLVKGVVATVAKETSDVAVQDAIPDLAETDELLDEEKDILESDFSTEKSEEKSESFWWFIFLALGAGLAAVLTPCVFPMIPMTVSFFMSGGAKRSEGILKGLIFGFSVALIYSLLGVLVAITKNPAIVNALSTHWIANIIFFALFIMFACSFFGLFEITLPTGLSNKLDAKADKGGLIAAFFMAAVLTLVSFSCTGPFVALLLVEAAMGTSVLKPILGMFTFGLAMGSPFMILSMSPALMKKMPKSGGWLNSVKIVFAFILLAFAMTFLLAIDTGYGLKLFTREVYLGIWIVIFSLMGFYLLGKIKFSHDSDVQHIGVFRLFLVIAVFSFVVYMIPGLFGAPLKMIASLTPPLTAQQFDLSQSQGYVPMEATSQKPVKHGDKFKLPLGLHGFFDYEEGLAYAKETGKPIFLDFTGHGCKNCKEMEGKIWSDPEVLALLKEYVIIALYTNDRTPLPEAEWITSKIDGKVKNTIGKRNYDFQMERFNTAMLPYYVTLDQDGKPTTNQGVGNIGKAEFIKYLKKGLGR
ncbi:MAG: thioredoxin family protein [Bacteroidales bacterium]|nr:thioredoxin family protein [Bacteroidales bacterium]